MVNEAILGALKSALERGESLKRAMMTLYNAGYKKEEIYEAAHSVNENNLPLQPVQQSLQKQPPTSNQVFMSSGKLAPSQKVQPVQQQPLQGVIQRISGYGQPIKPEGKTIIVVLGLLLLLLVGILATIFLFKEELLTFFNNLFS